MTENLAYIIFEVNLGWIGILSSEKLLLHITLPQHSANEVRQLLGSSTDDASWAPSLFKNLVARFINYFRGHQELFPDKLDLSHATCFQRKVWEMTRLIPFGETRSYLWVAKNINKPRAMRAVGQALGKNPLPIIIPCHRVIANSGKLGGFGGGLEMKKHLLSLETAATMR